MPTQTLHRLWSEGRTALSAWLSIPSAWTAELISRLGFDVVTIDMQHGLIDFQTALGMLQGIGNTAAVPMVRLPWNDPAIAMKMLDAGALGIICPMVNTGAEAARFVRACHYPPLGIRSFGPTRAAFSAGEDYFQRANERVLTFAQIETQEAIDNIEAIAATEGLSGLYVGPYDLSLSMGCRKLADLQDERLHGAIEKVVEAGKKYDRQLAVFAPSPEGAGQLSRMGFRLMAHGSDSGFLNKIMEAELQNLRSQVE